MSHTGRSVCTRERLRHHVDTSTIFYAADDRAEIAAGYEQTYELVCALRFYCD